MTTETTTTEYETLARNPGILTLIEWLEVNKPEEPDPNALYPYVSDWDAINYIHKLAKFAGYMSSPVAFNGAPLEAKTVLVNNPAEFVDFVNKTENKIYLYKVLRYDSVVSYKAVSKETGSIEALTVPVISPLHWKIRYAELKEGTLE